MQKTLDETSQKLMKAITAESQAQIKMQEMVKSQKRGYELAIATGGALSNDVDYLRMKVEACDKKLKCPICN